MPYASIYYYILIHFTCILVYYTFALQISGQPLMLHSSYFFSPSTSIWVRCRGRGKERICGYQSFFLCENLSALRLNSSGSRAIWMNEWMNCTHGTHIHTVHMCSCRCMVPLVRAQRQHHSHPKIEEKKYDKQCANTHTLHSQYPV